MHVCEFEKDLFRQNTIQKLNVFYCLLFLSNFTFHREDVLIETEIEAGTTIAIGEDLLAATDVVDLPMIIAVVEEDTTIGAVVATITDLLEEALVGVVVLRLPVSIRMVLQVVQEVVLQVVKEVVLQVQEVVIHTDHHAEEAALRHTVLVVAAVAVAVNLAPAAAMKVFQESPCWFATSALELPIKTSARHLDASEKFVMFTSREIITHSNLKALHSSSMPIPIVSILLYALINTD